MFTSHCILLVIYIVTFVSAFCSFSAVVAVPTHSSLTMSSIGGHTDAIIRQYDWRRLPPKVTSGNILYADEGIYNIDGYARSYASIRGGRDSSVYVSNWSSAYGSWRMRYYLPRTKRWVDVAIDMHSAARWWGEQRFGSKVWATGVKVVNPKHPYGWKAAWVVRSTWP